MPTQHFVNCDCAKTKSLFTRKRFAQFSYLSDASVLGPNDGDRFAGVSDDAERRRERRVARDVGVRLHRVAAANPDVGRGAAEVFVRRHVRHAVFLQRAKVTTLIFRNQQLPAV